MTRAAILSIFGSTLSLVLGHPVTALAQDAEPPAAIPPAPPLPAGVAAPQPAPEAAAPAQTRRAVVVFQADQPEAVLESDAATDGKTSPWYVVCQSPCERDVLATGNFRVGGPGFYPSRQFVIPPDRDRAVVNAEMKETSVALPLTLCVFGYLTMSAGLGVIFVGAIKEAQSGDGSGIVVGGAITSFVGIAMGTTGLVMLIVHAQDKESRAYVAKKHVPRVTLPAGFALETRGVVF
jgi:hypothetical protein